MPGPKYGSHDFPRGFGFTGSADRTEGRTQVRTHTRAAPQRFAEGGRVEAAKPKASPPVADKVPNPKPEPKISALDALKGKTRRDREKELGLKSGGRAYAKGGPVYQKGAEPGHSTAGRAESFNKQDQDTGGKTPLRPGYSKGGKAKKAMGGPVKYGKGGKSSKMRGDGC